MKKNRIILLLALLITCPQAQTLEFHTSNSKKMIKKQMAVLQPGTQPSKYGTFFWAAFSRPVTKEDVNLMDSSGISVAACAGKQGDGYVYRIKVTPDAAKAAVSLRETEK